VAPSAERIWLTNNQIEGCFPSIVADPACLATGQPAFQCGSEAVQLADLRHLAPPAQDYRGRISSGWQAAAAACAASDHEELARQFLKSKGEDS
jgi:hypothetical protein